MVHQGIDFEAWKEFSTMGEKKINSLWVKKINIKTYSNAAASSSLVGFYRNLWHYFNVVVNRKES